VRSVIATDAAQELSGSAQLSAAFRDERASFDGYRTCPAWTKPDSDAVYWGDASFRVSAIARLSYLLPPHRNHVKQIMQGQGDLVCIGAPLAASDEPITAVLEPVGVPEVAG
jgi:hypothetical protein